MKRFLSKAVAFLLILSMFTTAFASVPFVATENTAMGADIKTYYNMLKDYNKTLAHNKDLYKKQRTDNDAIKKYAANSLNDPDINALAKKITSSQKSDYDKIKAIYNWVAENIYYDKPLYNNMKKNKQALDVVSADPKVIYERRYAVCGGYTAFTVALLRAVGIPAKGISGVVNTDSQFGHGWTAAWVSKDKRWLLMDTTWGSGNTYNGSYYKGSVSSKYFDISLETLSKTHIITSTNEVKNTVYYHYNIKDKKDMRVELPYMSYTTYKSPGENPGHEFGGWYQDEALTKKWDFEKEKLKTDVHLYAKWIPKIYTVTFDPNGGTPAEKITVQAKYGDRLKLPKEPKREGYVFGGWALSKDGKQFWEFVKEPFVSTVKKDTTLYAYWEKPFTITFDSDGGTPVPSAKTGKNGLVPKPSVTPTKEGYTFAGWYYKKNAKESDRPVYFGEVMVDSDRTFYARWVKGTSSNSKNTNPTPTPKPIATPTPKPSTGITPDYTAAPLENGTYNIHPAVNTNLSFDMERSSMLDVTALIYYTNTTNNNQKFNLTRVGDYEYTITLVHSGKNLTSSGIMGGALKQSQADSNYKQVFTIMKYSDGYYRIQDFEGYFAGTSGGNPKSNTSVIMWEEGLNCGQELVFTKLDTVSPAVLSPTPIPTPTPTLTPTQQYLLDIYANGDTIEDDAYTISPYISSILKVQVPDSGKKDGTALTLFNTNEKDNQIFTLKKVGDNQYTITSKHSGLNWTSPGVLGGKITQSSPNNSSSQIFTITKVTSSNPYASSFGAYEIKDSKGFSVGFPIGVAAQEGNLVLKEAASEMFEWFMLVKANKPTPPPTLTPTPTPTPIPTPTEPSLIPDKLVPITYATETNPNTIKEGIYHLVVNNHYIRAYNDKPIVSKEAYAHFFSIESMGGRIYSLRSAHGSFLSLQYNDIRNGDEVILKWVDDTYLITGWIIEPVNVKKNQFTIRPLNNKNFYLSAENGKLVLTKNPSSPSNTIFTIFPYK